MQRTVMFVFATGSVKYSFTYFSSLQFRQDFAASLDVATGMDFVAGLINPVGKDVLPCCNR